MFLSSEILRAAQNLEHLMFLSSEILRAAQDLEHLKDFIQRDPARSAGSRAPYAYHFKIDSAARTTSSTLIALRQAKSFLQSCARH
jgi:hypothetical protein